MYLGTYQLLAIFLLFSLPTSAVPQKPTPPPEFPVHNITRFSTEHEVENLAVRRNGQILITTAAPAAQLYQIDPCNIHPPILIENFPTVKGAFGVTELYLDIFYVATGNFSVQTLSGVPGSFVVFEVNMRPFRVGANGKITHKAAVRKVAEIPHAGLLNGMTSMYDLHSPGTRKAWKGKTQSDRDFVLVADSLRFLVWHVSVSTGVVTIAAQDATMKPAADSKVPTAISGIKLRKNYLYYTNTATSKFYRLPIGKIFTVPAGAQAELLASNLPGDDFVLDAAGFAYVGGQAGVINFIDPSKGTVRPIAGTLGSNSSALVGPTAVQFGRTASDRNSIYVTTDGGILNTIIGSQGVSRIDVGDVAGY